MTYEQQNPLSHSSRGGEVQDEGFGGDAVRTLFLIALASPCACWELNLCSLEERQEGQTQNSFPKQKADVMEISWDTSKEGNLSARKDRFSEASQCCLASCLL